MKRKTYKFDKLCSRISLKAFWTLSIFLIIALIGVWVFQLQFLADKSGLLSDLQQRSLELSERTSEQGLYLSSQDMVKLDKVAQNLGFEKIGKVHYIRAVESTVLAR